jgi:hypothetical protein
MDRLRAERRGDADEVVRATADGDGAPVIDRERENESLVVVGMLADQIHPAGGRPHPVGNAPIAVGETARSGVGEVAGWIHVAADQVVSGWAGSVMVARAARNRAAVVSGSMSPMEAPIADSDPARTLNLPASRRGDELIVVDHEVGLPDGVHLAICVGSGDVS